MEPFGFAHLRGHGRQTADPTPTIVSKKKRLDVPELTKLQRLSFGRLYYPINMPVCRYQKKLIFDSLYNNVLIALPDELDAFFVAAVTILNFRRWFPKQKVLYVCTNAESSLNAAERFAEITAYSTGICVYAKLKKSERQLKWATENIIFATAESLITDVKSGEALSEVCLMVIEDAHRATAGSHPISELVRNCMFSKAKFRVLAYTDSKYDKVGVLQLVVMNLQINLIRSLGSIKEDVSLAVASPRMQKLYIPISDDMQRVSNEISKVLQSLESLLFEGGVFPTTDLKKLGNFSISYLQRKLQSVGIHLAEYYSDFFDLLTAYNILMCEGLTAFGNKLEALSARSATISEAVECNDILKEACLRPTISRPIDLQCHKLDALITLLRNTYSHYQGQKSVVVVLCRDRDPAFVNGLLTNLKARLSEQKPEFAFFVNDNGEKCRSKLSGNMMKDDLCNVIIMPCGFDAVELDVGYVDSLICMDEGLSTLYYTSAIKVITEGSLCALCSAGYETNICSFLTAEGTVNCIETNCIKGLQLCSDVLRMLPACPLPEIVEYWAEKVDENSGLLTAVERLDFEDRLAVDSPLDKSKLIKNNRDLLNFCVNETFLWQDRPQSFSMLGHSTTTLKLTNIFSKDPKVLEEQVLKFQKRPASKWLDEDSQQSGTCDVDLVELDSEDSSKASKANDFGKSVCQKRPAKNSLEKGGAKKKVPRVNRIESASFTLLKMLKPELTANDFVNHMEERDEYRKRQKQMTEIIEKLNRLVRM